MVERNRQFSSFARAAHGVRRRWREGTRAWGRLRRPFTAIILTAGVALALLWYASGPALMSREPQLGHVVRAYGTVRMGSEWKRLETGKGLTTPVRSGEQIQTGEHSAAQVLFFGGSRLELEAGSVAQVYREQGQVVVRVILGTGYFEFSGDSELGRSFAWVKPNGKLALVPRDSRVVMALHAARRIEDAVEDQAIEIKVIEADSRDPENVELAMLANGGGEVEGFVPLIVPPIVERARAGDEESAEPTVLGRHLASLRDAGIGHPRAIFPPSEAVLNLETAIKSAFKWTTVRGPLANPVVGYEVVVRPAFNYEVEDTARKNQIFRTKGLPEFGSEEDPENPQTASLPLDRIGGTGVFLWSVRAVTANGTRGPASASRWLEIKFPEMLRAPEILTPRVE